MSATREDWSRRQWDVCVRFGVEPHPAPSDLKVGISRNVRTGVGPLNGMRIAPEGDTTGWYIWAGIERGDDPDFFVPLHVEHLEDWCPAVIPYLQEDVWHDPQLLADGRAD